MKENRVAAVKMATTSSSSALDLLRPDPPVDKPEATEKEPEEEDELVSNNSELLLFMFIDKIVEKK